MASSCEGKNALRTQVLILQMYHGSDLGSLKHESGMIRGMIRNPIFLEFRKPCCLRLFSFTVNPPWLRWLDLPTCRPAGMSSGPLLMHL